MESIADSSLLAYILSYKLFLITWSQLVSLSPFPILLNFTRQIASCLHYKSPQMLHRIEFYGYSGAHRGVSCDTVN